MRVCDAIAETVREETPAHVETFESPEADADLPRVVYISCHNSPEHYADAVRAFGTSIYGLSRLNAPWLLNPNEMARRRRGGPGFVDPCKQSSDPRPLLPAQPGTRIRRLHRHSNKVEPAGREERDFQPGRQDRAADRRNRRCRDVGRRRERLHGGHQDGPGLRKHRHQRCILDLRGTSRQWQSAPRTPARSAGNSYHGMGPERVDVGGKHSRIRSSRCRQWTGSLVGRP